MSAFGGKADITPVNARTVRMLVITVPLTLLWSMLPVGPIQRR